MRMAGESWSTMVGKLCDSCKTVSASLYCRADSAFLCKGCDGKVHMVNKLSSRHARVWMCEVCEQAPASVTCKADAAALCATCDRDIHTANPLARRHERVPVVPFYGSSSSSMVDFHGDDGGGSAISTAANDKYFSDFDGGGEGSDEAEREEEAEAASWLLPTPNPNKITDDGPELKSADYLFNGMDPYLDLDLISGDKKQQNHQNRHYSSGTDGVVPVQRKHWHYQPPPQPPVVNGFPTYDIDYSGSKPFMYDFNSQSITQSVRVSSPSLEVGVVPDHNTMSDASNTLAAKATGDAVPNPISGLDREARVLRYREKRKNRKFEKTIRYASRKAYAETRPRIKGRFAKRSEMEVDGLNGADASYGVVPSF